MKEDDIRDGGRQLRRDRFRASESKAALKNRGPRTIGRNPKPPSSDKQTFGPAVRSRRLALAESDRRSVVADVCETVQFVQPVNPSGMRLGF